MAALSLAPAVAQEKIRIGVPLPLSGTSAQFCEPMLKGVQMYAEELNAKGGLLGKKIEIVARDSKAKPEEAVRVARELIVRERVNFLVGTFTSAEGPAVSEIAKENKTVLMALGPKTDRLTAPEALHPYVFRVSANTTTEGRAAAALMARWKVTRVATIAPDFAYGQDGVKVFVAHLKKLRPDIQIVDQQWPKITESDYTPFITAQKAAKPEAVFSIICCGQFTPFAKQANGLGYFKALNNNFIAVAEGGSIESLRSLGAEYPVGIWGNSYDAFNYKPQDPAVAKAHSDFLAKVRTFTKEQYPASWVVSGYLGMQYLSEAVKKANSLDSSKVSAALKGLTLDTPMGKLTMRAKDQQLTRGMVWGQAKIVKDVPFPVLDPIEYIDAAPLMD
ncbi:ABC transporter substrate-binding protein [Massilia sp. W12]|uniref:ABC transporter substrate-binding protein n=1 Tax=Massilia sp. W12 TaxID=3126507 RepID=UPI0030CDB3D3